MKKLIPILVAAFAFSCSTQDGSSEKLTHLQTELDSLRTLVQSSSSEEKGQITTFLTFQNNDAEEAMNFYMELFENSKITEIQRYGADGPMKEGTIMMARFELNGSQFACSDSYIKHEWDFSPGISNWVDCKSNEEIEMLLAKLSENGEVLMPLDNYGFSQKFSWVVDRFGVSWQLTLG